MLVGGSVVLVLFWPETGPTLAGDSGLRTLSLILRLTVRGFGAWPEQGRRLRPWPETPATAGAETPAPACWLGSSHSQ